MSLTYPLTLPTSVSFNEMSYLPRTVVGFNASKFTGQQQNYVWPGQWWEFKAKLPPLTTDAIADEWIAFLLSLNGREGTFYAGPSTRYSPNDSGTYATVRAGTVANDTTINLTYTDGAHPAQVGDWIQVGTTTASKLHRVVKVGTTVGTAGSVDVWPRTRSAYAAATAVNFRSPVGLFRLAEGSMDWSVNLAKHVGLELNAMEVL